jgi:hypothetical protein
MEVDFATEDLAHARSGSQLIWKASMETTTLTGHHFPQRGLQTFSMYARWPDGPAAASFEINGRCLTEGKHHPDGLKPLLDFDYNIREDRVNSHRCKCTSHILDTGADAILKLDSLL